MRLTESEIDNKVAELELLEGQVKQLEAMIDSLKSDIKGELDARKVDVINTGINKVWYSVYSKRSVDTEKLKQDGLYDAYSRSSAIIQFKITKCNKEEN